MESVIGKKMELWSTDDEEIALLKERVSEAGRIAVNELKDQAQKPGRKRKIGEEIGRSDVRDRDDDVVEAGLPVKRKKIKGRRR